MADYQRAFHVVLKETKINSLKEKQVEILETILNNNNCLAILPTGYGKSLPYQLYLPVIRALGDDWSKKKNSKVIVCCPLTSIMEDQVKKLKQTTLVSAEYLGSSPEADSAISNGDVDLIYGSPELLVGNVQRREIIQKLDVSLIVIDEFHTIATWGGMGNEEEAFRKWFRHLGELRSMFPNAVLLALSATCTKIIEKRVLNVLGIDKKTIKSIRLSPNKENIKFIVNKIPNSMESAMFWVMEALLTK
ncbi:ATP-dependent DNA helicase RecQ-like [Saccostrea cucullata]|uniref:ATP-dependent DNA helicase RecQ-like n=1 Tax=Saccostrea cuccullata TaxID=36930 RepID=UPI002ED5AD80